ncbi:MAG TPA: heparan-alpha-glucosaminide N-acetyltransferase domain-containing protein [Puia sp.]|nr:heparan-alpha-glucosaminide N-acetyltransferase domain-containing protein [Puia sp.]
MTLPKERFLALDVFRGMTICFMIIVNTSGSHFTYSPLEHAHWFGFTPTDLVFPSFLFAVGNAMSFSTKRWAEMSSAQVLGKIFKRTAIIFLCGFLLYWFPFFQYNDAHHLVLSPLSHTRILGVLQRIALAYGVAALLIYYCKPRTVIAISVIILLLYWALLMFGGDLTMTGNLGQKIDLWLMGPNHLYHGEGVPFDPEGWLSTLPSVVNVTFGFYIGQFIQKKGKTYEGLARLLLLGFAFIVIAYFWDLVFPISKKLWTSSFVAYTVGLDCVILGSVIYLIDFLGKTKWTWFFTIFGKNPLFIYLVSEVGATILYTINPQPDTDTVSWLYQHIYRHAGLYFGSLLFAISWMLFCWLVGYVLDKKKIYVRV